MHAAPLLLLIHLRRILRASHSYIETVQPIIQLGTHYLASISLFHTGHTCRTDSHKYLRLWDAWFSPYYRQPCFTKFVMSSSFLFSIVCANNYRRLYYILTEFSYAFCLFIFYHYRHRRSLIDYITLQLSIELYFNSRELRFFQLRRHASLTWYVTLNANIYSRCRQHNRFLALSWNAETAEFSYFIYCRQI